MTHHYAYDVMGNLIECPEEVLLQYQAWGIADDTAIRMYAAGFTPEVLLPYLAVQSTMFIDNLGFFLKLPASSIPSPKRRKSRLQLKPLKPWQKKAIEGEKRIRIHKGK